MFVIETLVTLVIFYVRFFHCADPQRHAFCLVRIERRGN